MRKSPVAYLTDEEYTNLPAHMRALHVARSKVGQRESGGNNRGPFVERLLARLGLAPGNAWCAAFVTTCLLDAGVPSKYLPKGPAAVWNWYKDAKALGCLTDYGNRGSLIYRVQSNRKGHIGFVADRRSVVARTIEGNTGPDGGRDGDGVYEKKRIFGNTWKSIDLAKYLKAKGYSESGS